MLRKVKVLRSGDCRVILQLETAFSGRKIDRRVLAADVDAELGLITSVWSRIGQMARRSTPERSRARVKSDSSQRRRCRRGRRQDRREKQNTQEHPGVTWCTDGMILEKSLKHLGPVQVHWMKCANCVTKQENCAHACVR